MKTLLTFLLFCVTLPALASRPDHDQCYGWAKNALAITELRDNKVGKDEMFKRLEAMAAAAYQKEGSIVQDEDDLKHLLNMFNMIYDNGDIEKATPGMIYDHVLEGCLKGISKDKSEMPEWIEKSGPQIRD